MAQQPRGFPDDAPVLARPFELQPPARTSGFNEDADDPLRQTLTQAEKTSADAAARVFQLRLKTGLPADVITRHVDDVEREASRQDFDPEKFRRESPLLAAWLQEHPQNAAVAHDDLPALGTLERVLRVGSNSARSLAAGLPRANVGIWGAAQFSAEALGLSSWAEYFKRARVQAGAIADATRGPQAGAGDLEKAVYSGFESLSMTVPGLAMSVVSGNPAPLLATLGTQTGGEAYGQARDAGVGVTQAGVFGLSQAAVEVATEMIPASLLLKDLGKHAGLLKTLLHQAASEIPGEQVATLLQDLNQWATLNPDQPFSEYLAERPSAALQTLVATVTMVGAQTSLATALDRITNSSTSSRVVEDLHAAAAESKTHGRAPEILRTFVEQATKDGLTHVYAPAAEFTEYFQSKGEDPAALAAELTGDPDALALAQATGGDLAIPTGSYLARIVGSGHEQFFVDELRLSPEQMNGRETRDALKAEAAAASTEGEPPAPPDRGIYDAMAAKLTATNRFTPQEVDAQAALYQTVFTAMASRPGVDPTALFARFSGPVVSEGGPAAAATPGAPARASSGLPDVPASVAGAGETAAQQATRRAGHLEAMTAVLTRDAQRVDPTVDPATIRAELERRLERAEDQQSLAADDGRGVGLLEAIAQRGGLWWETRTGAYKGEVEHHAVEGTDKKDVRDRGTRYANVKTWNGIPGVFNAEGLPPDQMVRSLMQDPQFAYLEDDLQRLLAAVGEAMHAEAPTHALPGTGELAALGIKPGTKWWAGSSIAPSGSIESSDVDETEPADGDASFNVDEFAQRASDVAEFGGLDMGDGAAADLTQFAAANAAQVAARRAWLERRINEARADNREDWDALRQLQDLQDAEADRTIAERDAGTEFHQTDVVPPFYSRLARAVEASKLAKASGAQWKATIKNAKVGINQDEFALVRVDDLDNAKVYTREEVLQYLAEHEVRVVPVTLGGDGTEDFAAERRTIHDAGYFLQTNPGTPWDPTLYLVNEEDGPITDGAEMEDVPLAVRTAFERVTETNRRQAREAAGHVRVLQTAGYDVWTDEEGADDTGLARMVLVNRESGVPISPHDDVPRHVVDAFQRLLAPPAVDAPPYSAYQEPGGDAGSYREVFLTAPPAPPSDDPTFRLDLQNTFPDGSRVWHVEVDGQVWHGSADEPLRFTSREGEDEASVLARVRSTWQQRPSGQMVDRTWRDGHDAYRAIENPIVRLRFNTRTATTADGTKSTVLFLEEVQPPAAREQKKMPALFLKHWRELAFKWALRHAVDRGYAGVAWTSGAMQAARYSLEKQVRKIEWRPLESSLNGVTDTGRHVVIDLPTGLARVDLKADGTVDHVFGVAPGTWIGQHITDVIGKEVGDRILSSTAGQLEGEGLKIGGEGLKKLYNVDFRNVVKSLPAVKKNGGAVTMMPLATGVWSFDEGPAHFVEGGEAEGFARGEGLDEVTASDVLARVEELLAGPEDEAFLGAHDDPDATRARVQPVVDAMEQRGLSYAEAMDQFGAEDISGWLGFGGHWVEPQLKGPPDVPFLPITPAMRDAIAAGQAYFQDEPAAPDAKTKGTYNPVTNTIRLFKTADRSTFLHESAHLFLEVLSDLAAAPDAPAQLQADMQTLFTSWGFEGDLAAWRALTNEERRAGHEQFARGWEKYLGEGKAPTPELQPLFAKFRSWLLGIYHTLRRLNVPLTDDVRAVMDRMVATDEAIAEAEADVGIRALFSDAASAGVSETEFEGYRDRLQAAHDDATARLQARLLTELAREEERWWQEQRAAVRAEVAADVAQRPVYRAIASMRGTLEDGTPATPLSRAFLIAQFGRQILRKLPRPYLYSAESGLPPDTVAQIFGFDSGEALIGAVLAAPAMDAAIDSETDARMLEQHGDLFHDRDRLATQAREALAGAHRDQVVRVELAMLAKLRAAAAPSVRATKEGQKGTARAGADRLRTEMPDQATLQRAAVAQVAAMRLRDIRPDRFFAAARRGSRLATEAAAKQDFDTAVEAKQAELVNLALYREALAAREAVDAARETFAKMFGPDAAIGKRRDLDYVHAARAIAAQYFWPEKRLETARAGLQLIQAHDPELYAMLDEQITAAQAAGTDLASLTFEAFGVMRDAVDALWDQARRTQQMLVDGQLVDRNEAIASLVGRLEELGAPETEQYHSKLELSLLGARAAMTRVEHWVTYLDGGNPHGAFRRFFWNPISDATSTYRVARAAYLEQYFALVKTIEGRLKPGVIAAPELGFEFGREDGNGRAALLHALLHTGNESNYQKLLRGYGWGTQRDDGTLDDGKWTRFMDRMYREGVVTKADLDFVQAVWDLVGSVKGEAQAAHKEMYGRYFNEITATPLETPFGMYAGGYVPALVDPLRVATASIYEEKAALGGNDNASMFPTGGKGFTKARQEQYAKPLALNLRLIPSHLDKVLRFIHIEPRVKDVGRLLWTHAMRDRLNAYDPTAIQSLLVPWLQRTALQRVAKASQGHDGRAADQVFRVLRARTGLNMMAGHVMNTLQQFTGGFIAATKVRPRYLRNALWRYVTQHETFLRAVDESAFMQTRMTPAAFALQQELEDLLLNPSPYERIQDWGNKHGYILQALTQNIVDQIAWAGGYEQATELRGATHAEAIREADSVVRQTQGSFEASDVAGFEAKIPFIRAFTMFSGYFNMLANVNGTELALVVRDLGLRKGAGRAMYVYLFGFMLPAVVSEAITQAISGWDDDDDDDTHLDELMSLFFGSQFRTAAAMIPFAGQAGTALYNYYATNSPADDRISSSPAISSIEATIRAPGEVYEAIVNEGPKRKAVRDALDLLGLLTGLPFGAVKRPLGYLADVVDEREHPDDAAELARGLVSGRAQDAR